MHFENINGDLYLVTLDGKCVHFQEQWLLDLLTLPKIAVGTVMPYLLNTVYPNLHKKEMKIMHHVGPDEVIKAVKSLSPSVRNNLLYL